ncbi:MAG: hypothetical protein ABI041_03665 [Bdellovibrionia bacterium]
MRKYSRISKVALIGMAFSLSISTLAFRKSAPSKDVATAQSKTAAAAPQWTEKMQGLYSTLSDILTDISGDERFNDPKNKGRIEAHAKKLASLAHELEKKGMVSPDHDPTVEILSGLFAEEAQYAYEELKRGNRSYARAKLRSISGYCVACHTRNSSGPQFPKLPSKLGASDLTGVERGEYYAATRQFDLAQEEFNKVIVDLPHSQSHPMEWERGVQQSLSIAVRVKKDPARALKIVEQVLSNAGAPYFYKQNALKWKKSIEDWQSEGKQKSATEEGLYSEAVRLISEAHKLQRYPMDRSADILYLRATAVLHELLQLSPSGKRSGEAFLMAGLSYEVLRPLNLEELHDFYFEACIKKTPHTSLAELCYERYEESVYFGYTGSSGTALPKDVKDRLSKYEAMAHPTAPVTN